MSDSIILHQKVTGASSRDLADIGTAKQMADVLDRHYPNHHWAVNVDSAQGIATVKNFRLSGNWGFVLKLGDTYSGSEFDKRVMMAGGELLERYRLHRGSFRENEYGILPVNFAGQHEASI